MSLVWYFAYGSNMQSATLRGRRGIEFRRALPVAVASWRLVLDKPALVLSDQTFANIVPDPAGEVLGVAFEVTEADLAHVELTEGVPLGNYRRQTVAVCPLASVPEAPAEAFTLVSDQRATPRPSPRYMQLMIEGAIEHGLPADYVEALRQVPTFPESPAARAVRSLVDDVMRRLRR